MMTRKPFTYEPEVYTIGEGRTVKQRRDALVTAAFTGAGARRTPRSEEAVQTMIEGFALEGYGEIANRLGTAKRLLMGGACANR